jgi:hypothetical protein
VTASDDLSYVVSGAVYDVALLMRVARVFVRLPAAPRAALVRTMEIFGEEGPHNLPITQFRPEDRLPVGDAQGTRMLVCAFKAWQVRVYGAVVRIDGRPTFIGSEIDDSKKQDKADRGCLTRAARNLRPYVQA